MADPYKLTSEQHPGRHVWGCGVCHHTCINEHHATICCACDGCGARPIRRGYRRCDACTAAEHKRIAHERYVSELRLIAAAELVDLTDYDDEQVSTTPHGEEDSYRDAGDEILDAEGERMAWAWACTIMMLGPASLDAHDIVSSAVEEWFDGAVEMFDVDALQKLLDEWCASHPRARCWYADHTRIVVLDPDRRAEVEEMVASAKRELAEIEAARPTWWRPAEPTGG